MRPRSSNRSVIVALGASALVHLLIVVPLLMAMFAAGGAPPRVEAMFSSEALKPEDEQKHDQEREPVLGIEKSSASTLTWIGYEEYLEHLAQLSEVEQAAFTDAPTGTDAIPEEVQSPVEEVVEAEPVEPVEPVEVEVVEKPIEEPVEEVVAAETVEPVDPLPSLELPARLPEIDLARVARVLEFVGLTSRERDEGESPERVETEVEREESAEVAQVEPVEAAQQERDEATDQAQPVEPSEPATSDSPGEPADSADKQSNPTSIVEVPQANWRLGRPLAAQGIELKPQRPHFSIMQRLTSSPCNPLVEMHFNRAGAVTEATIVESSRDASINAAIEASVYRWRADGLAIRGLREEQTFAVRIRIILNPYARCP